MHAALSFSLYSGNYLLKKKQENLYVCTFNNAEHAEYTECILTTLNSITVSQIVKRNETLI